jgi:hypothetical protein
MDINCFRFLSLFYLALPICLTAQNSGVPPSGKNAPVIAAESVQFSQGVPVPQVGASPLMGDPIHCAPDGTAFLDLPQPPPTFDTHVIYSVDHSQKVVSFPVYQIQGLSGITLLSYYPSDSEVAFLVYATKKEDQPLTNSDSDTFPAKGQYFIALFDRDGKFDKLDTLDLPFVPKNLAIFDSGDMVVLGYDQNNQLSRMALLDSSGSLLRYFDPQSALSANNIGKSFGQGFGGSALNEALSTAQFVPYEHNLLLVSRGSRLPVQILRESGVDREVPLDLPAGEMISTFIPSTGPNWYVRSMVPSGSHGLGKSVSVYQIDPETGKPIKNLSMGLLILAVGCERDGKFSAFRYDEDKKQVLLLEGQE